MSYQTVSILAEMPDVIEASFLTDAFFKAIQGAKGIEVSVKNGVFRLEAEKGVFRQLCENDLLPVSVSAAFRRADERLAAYDAGRGFGKTLWEALMSHHKIGQTPVAVAVEIVPEMNSLRLSVNRHYV